MGCPGARRTVEPKDHSLGCLALILCIAAPAPLWAADAPSATPGSDTLAEIVVTAEKRESTVEKTPLSITAISGADLQSRGLSSAQEAIQAVPGVAVSSAGPGQAQYEIRGLSAGGGESPTIGFYFGETPITPPATATTGKSLIDPDLYDLARLEVLRGPQGTLYGAGSMGGTVKFVPNEPDLSSVYGSSRTTLSGTSGGGFNYAERTMINLPINDLLALRIVGTYAHNSGWIDRIVLDDFPLPTNGGLTRGNVLSAPVSTVHSGVNDELLTGARVALLFKPNDILTVTPSIFYQRIGQGGENAYDSDPGITNAQYQPFDVAEPFKDTFTIYALPITLALTDFSITSATSYWNRTTQQVQDASEGVQDAFSVPAFPVSEGGIGPVQPNEVDTTHEFSQELRFSSTGNGNFQWIVGAFFSDFYDNLNLSVDNIPGLLTAEDGAFGTTNLAHVVEPLHIRQEAGFMNLSYQFQYGVKLEAGARYYAYQSSLQSAANGFAYGGNTPVVNDARASADGLNPMVNLSYTPEGGPLLYVTAAKGFREGAGNFPIPTTGTIGSECLANLQAIGRSSAPPLYDPDTVWSYELGEKGRFWDGRVTLNTDVFYTKWNSVQQQVGLACGLAFTTNGPDASVKGAELELQALVLPGLSFIQSVGFADASFLENYPSAAITAGQALYDSPRWTISSNLRYQHPIGTVDLVAEVQNSYQSPTIDINYQVNELSGRDLTNLRLGVEKKKWSVYGFVNNVLNRHYAIEYLNLLAITGPDYSRIATNQPLTAGVDVEFKY